MSKSAPRASYHAMIAPPAPSETIAGPIWLPGWMQTAFPTTLQPIPTPASGRQVLREDVRVSELVVDPGDQGAARSVRGENREALVPRRSRGGVGTPGDSASGGLAGGLDVVVARHV